MGAEKGPNPEMNKLPGIRTRISSLTTFRTIWVFVLSMYGEFSTFFTKAFTSVLVLNRAIIMESHSPVMS